METNKQKYHAYLLSKSWALKRKKLKALRKYKCEMCNSIKNLHVHHLHYKNIFHEKMEDLQLLCKACHYKTHKKTFPKKPKAKKQKISVSRTYLAETICLLGYKAAADILRKARGAATGTMEKRKAKKYVMKYLGSKPIQGKRFIPKTALRKARK